MTELRQIDKEIAQRVFGAVVVSRSTEDDLWEKYEHFSRPLRCFTFNHQDAWYAFEYLKTGPSVKVIVQWGIFRDNRWAVAISQRLLYYLEYGKTIPEALCKAILAYKK